MGEFHDSIIEWDDDNTINAVRAAIEEKYECFLINADINCFEKLKVCKPDLVFNIAEGVSGPNREANIPAILEMLNIPYTGSDVATLANTLDKSRAHEILRANFIKVPNSICVNTEQELEKIEELDVDKDYILKPCWEGSSKGITNDSIYNRIDEIIEAVISLLNTYNQPVLIEEFLNGKEFTAAVLGNYPKLTVLPIVELDFNKLPFGANPIYSYEAKWVWDKQDEPLEIFKCPAEIDEELYLQIENIAKKAFIAMRCKDWARIDIRLNNNNIPHILEINPLPGILPDPNSNSCFPKAARAFGMDYDTLIHSIIDCALERMCLTV